MGHDYDDKYYNKYFGKFRGSVAAIDDPEQLGRIKVRVPTVYGSDPQTGETPVSGWAWPCFGGGNANQGFFFPPSIGDVVWVEFEEGDHERPIWSHGAWTLLGGQNNFPAHARSTYDESDNKMRGMDDVPGSKLNSDYGKVVGFISPGGSRVEADDSAGVERLIVEHSTGSRFEVLPDGSVHRITNGNERRLVNGSLTTKVVEKEIKDVLGSSTSTYGKTRKVTDNADYEYINVAGATYKYKSIDISCETETRTVTGPQIIRVVGTSQRTYTETASESIFGSYNQLITDTAQWIIANSTGLIPADAALLHVTNPLNGRINLKVGADITDLSNNQLLIRHPITKLIPGTADIVLKAVAHMALNAPLVTVGPLNETVVGKEPVVKGISLLAWLDTHIHPVAGAATGVPVLPASSLSTLILSGAGAPVAGLWTI